MRFLGISFCVLLSPFVCMWEPPNDSTNHHNWNKDQLSYFNKILQSDNSRIYLLVCRVSVFPHICLACSDTIVMNGALGAMLVSFYYRPTLRIYIFPHRRFTTAQAINLLHSFHCSLINIEWFLHVYGWVAMHTMPQFYWSKTSVRTFFLHVFMLKSLTKHSAYYSKKNKNLDRLTYGPFIFRVAEMPLQLSLLSG